MKSMKVPRPSLDAFRFYNTMIFHGWLRMFITGVLALTGGTMLFGAPLDPITHDTIETLHVVFGLLGVYLIVAHVVGYYLNSVMKLPKYQAVKKHMSDSGWIMVVLAALSLVSGVALIFGQHLTPERRGLVTQVHIFAALTYLVMVFVHLWYYLRHWKPALRGAHSGAAAGTAAGAQANPKATGDAPAGSARAKQGTAS
jgi:hypothetical protein